MKGRILSVIALIALLPLGAKAGGEYKLVWADEFNATTLNESDNWEIEVNGDGGGNAELQYYRRENITMGSEPISGERCLIIEAKKENFNNKKATSGRLITRNKVSFKYGKLEARVKSPKTANGLWPAFWVMGSDITTVGWPRCGEIDILEMGNSEGIKNGTQDRYFNGACHWGYYENGWYPMYAKASTNSYGMQDDFHLFTLVWTPQKLSMYLDQDKYPDVKPYFEMNIDGYADAKAPGHYFNKEFFVLFNLAVGGNFTGIWDINKITGLSNGPAYMYVDYVRMYQRGDAGESYNGPVISDSKDQSYPSLFTLYPIPVRNILRVDGPNIRNITIYSLDGVQLVNVADQREISISHLSDGNYLARISTDDDRVETQIIQVKKQL